MCRPAVLLMSLVSLAAPIAAPAQQGRELDAARAEAQYNAGETFVRSQDVDGLLSGIVTRLGAANPEAGTVSIRAHALRSATPYVFTLENGALYASTGLIARLRNESQLAALIAAEIAALVRDDKTTGDEAKQRRARRRLLPDLLLITATAGLAAPAMINRDAARDRGTDAELQRASDQVALGWLQAAGYDPAQAQEGLRLVLQALLAEQRMGASPFNNEKELQARIQSFEQGQPAAGSAADPSLAGTSSSYWPIARRLLVDIARADLDSADISSVGAVIDAIEREDGPGLHSACMRAEFVRKTTSDKARLPEVIQAYEKCVAFPDVNPVWFRDLGHLYRRNADADGARRNFEIYLQRAPGAVDAPIIKGYLQGP
jgi:hypothetical protein